ncbi:T6SS phospholipase effector Tle1-like catalytic domain-containing protein, partial [Escherichia coli]|uniref:T6SS phospholipase effector Tle1-like catalytic domain-containing protein n=1 Tax=Escherichia coli TaxID=562 RepID=UPI0013D13958
VIDLATAWFLSQHVCDAYRYLMRYYQEGDQIYIFGFSRGAYTARVVAAMVHKVGLLTQGNEELIPFAWDMFAKQTDENIYR